ncbi:MAG: tyrosine-type recombinase/integrase [Clostridiales bacterium]|nr:tyrosine-type recombinase/integrase [Clostridiales bacterium]
MERARILKEFEEYLTQEERERATIRKYLRDAEGFLFWLGNREVSKKQVVLWKEELAEKQYSPITVNGKLAAVNKLLHSLGKPDCRVKYLKIQRRLFRSTERDLTKEEYTRLVETALSEGRERLALLMESICATGIRVSEVRYFTVEAAEAGRAEISLKGKIRTILIPGKLCRKLLKYARKQKIASGEIFLTRSGKSMSRHQIWAEMKALCAHAKVRASKVFPHNLRHLFARAFYRACRDVVRLAGVLGHSSIETTRIYLITTGVEYRKQMSRLGLIS